AEGAEDVVERVRSEARHEADRKRKGRHREPGVPLEKPVGRELPHDLLATPRRLAHRVGDVEVLDLNAIGAPRLVKIDPHADAARDPGLEAEGIGGEGELALDPAPRALEEDRSDLRVLLAVAVALEEREADVTLVLRPVPAGDLPDEPERPGKRRLERGLRR